MTFKTHTEKKFKTPLGSKTSPEDITIQEITAKIFFATFANGERLTLAAEKTRHGYKILDFLTGRLISTMETSAGVRRVSLREAVTDCQINIDLEIWKPEAFTKAREGCDILNAQGDLPAWITAVAKAA
mgnify:CR=1 FL=1